MSTNLLDTIFKTTEASHGTALEEYKQLLLSDDPQNAGRLTDVAESLGFSFDRLASDQAILRNAERLRTAAGDLDEAETALQEALAASEKHGESMRKKIDALKQKQAELTAALNQASSRAARAMTATQRLDELHAEHVDLFAEEATETEAAEHERLQALPTAADLRAELDDVKELEAEADQVVEKLADEAFAMSSGDEGKTAAIAAKDSAANKRNELSCRRATLYQAIDKAETAKRNLDAGG